MTVSGMGVASVTTQTRTAWSGGASRAARASAPAAPSTAGSGQFARLPIGARPAHTLFIPVSVDLGGGGSVGTLEIFRGGQIAVFSTSPADAKAATSLDGVSFPVNS